MDVIENLQEGTQNDQATPSEETAKIIGPVIAERAPWSKCDKCQVRLAMWNRRWCRPCALLWQRQHLDYRGRDTIKDYSPAWELEIPERYQAADLGHLAKPLVEQFMGLPDDMGLLLWGPPGRGKTHSTAAFAKHLWSDGWDFKRISYDWLMLEIRDTYKASAEQTEKMVIQPLIQVGKLFIEDVGVTVKSGHEESDFSLRTFVQLLDQRIERCLATYVTSNKSVEELAKSFDARVASRLRQACQVIKLTGPDRRAK